MKRVAVTQRDLDNSNGAFRWVNRSDILHAMMEHDNWHDWLDEIADCDTDDALGEVADKIERAFYGDTYEEQLNEYRNGTRELYPFNTRQHFANSLWEVVCELRWEYDD